MSASGGTFGEPGTGNSTPAPVEPITAVHGYGLQISSTTDRPNSALSPAISKPTAWSEPGSIPSAMRRRTGVNAGENPQLQPSVANPSRYAVRHLDCSRPKNQPV